MLELINRRAVMEIAMSYCPDDDGCCSKAGHDIREMLDEIEALPTTKAEPVRHGHWDTINTLCDAVSDQPCGCDACPYGDTVDDDGICEVWRNINA